MSLELELNRFLRALRAEWDREFAAAVPDPSLTCRLNFDRLMEGKASIPAAWPAPFTIDTNRRPGMVEVYDGHWVRAGIDIRSAA